MDYSRNQKVSKKDLEERVEKLERTVNEVCYTLYDLIGHLRGMKSNQELRAIPPPECPPICARPVEEESR
jgi:hypothetical protein